MRSVVAAAVLGATLLTACGEQSASGGEAWPAVDVRTVSDEVVSSGSWVGEPLVVNFWFSTCIPCERELADFAAVDAEVGDEVRFIGVNPIDSPERMVEFASERGVTYDLMQDYLAELQVELEITSFPATFFVASSGEIVESTGVLDESTLSDKVDNLLAADSES